MFYRSLFAFCCLCILALHSNADESYRECDAVRQRAELTYDASLVVSIMRDTANEVCSFRVGIKPPKGTEPSSVSGAVAIRYSELSQAPPEDRNSVVDELAQLFLGALIDPWLKDGPIGLTSLADSLKQEHLPEIGNCAVKAIYDKQEFEKVNDTISCGLIETGQFVVEVHADDLMLALVLPRASAA